MAVRWQRALQACCKLPSKYVVLSDAQVAYVLAHPNALNCRDAGSHTIIYQPNSVAYYEDKVKSFVPWQDLEKCRNQPGEPPGGPTWEHDLEH
ncbi:hypothetical protein N8T08_003898 [Aspergillus melleus]|uniref:Uncharacterized protein n=1 Tax=Aspergillus melleus TaxID=138277 RepID=A0ACC3B5J9_9EURO|nr:hypothetical protein N8T08_003898 [Aspergillus melleus]